MAAQLVTIYWRDIPAQVTPQQGRTREKALLDARFQHAIDRAAMVAGMDDTDSYVAQWRRETTDLDGNMAAAVADEIARIDAAYDRESLERLVRAGGVEDAD
ncbi:MAG: virulence factor [Actinomycetota bacterium]|nr:virulence factor [Actinomycetota bacterium]